MLVKMILLLKKLNSKGFFLIPKLQEMLLIKGLSSEGCLF
jgi:hypothetical protein